MAMGRFEGSVVVATSGDSFTFDTLLADATPGLKTVAWRTVTTDGSGNTVTSSTTYFSFQLEDDLATGDVRLQSLGLQRDTGDATDGITIAPTLAGTLAGDFQGGDGCG